MVYRSQWLRTILSVTLLCSLALTGIQHSQAANENLVAALETLKSGVQVKRSDSAEWISVRKESLVGVGDSIRTDKDGHARITFFADGTDTEVLPDSEFRIDDFSGTDDKYNLSVTVVLGQTSQRISKLLDNGSSYTINTMGIEMAVRGTVFAVRVEKGGRSATLVQQGKVATKVNGKPGNTPGESGDAADVPAGFGVRGEANKGLSDVVKADNFRQLDSALDGCNAVVSTFSDVVLNVRTGPSLLFPKIATIDNKTLHKIIGTTETTKWYRIAFQGGFAWVYAPAIKLDTSCAGLRQYPDDFGPENVALYSGLSPTVNLIATSTPTATVPPTATRTVGK